MKRSHLLPALGLFAGALFWGCFSDKSVDPTSPDTVEELQLKGSISGTVTDSVGTGISGVAVTLDSGGFATNTDSLGRYTIPDVPGRTWTLRFTKTNWADTSLPGVVLAIDEDRKGVDIRMRRKLDTAIALDTTGSFAGTVKDTAGKLLSNVNVLLVGGKGQSTVTDSVGGFVLSGVPAGSWAISFGRSGYADTAIAGLSIARKEKKTGIVATMRPRIDTLVAIDTVRQILGTLANPARVARLEVTASSLNGASIPVTSLSWDPSGAWMAQLRSVRDSGTLKMIARDSAGHATGYGSFTFKAAKTLLVVPTFDALNALPKLDAGKDTTVPVGRTILLKAQARDTLDNAGIVSIEWSCGTSTTWTPEGANGYNLTLPRDSGSLTCRVRATDKDSNVVTDSLVLHMMNRAATITGFADTTIYSATVGFSIKVKDTNGVAKVLWSFGDGETDSTFTGTNSTVTHIYAGTFSVTKAVSVTATVVDSMGGTTSFSNMVTITNQAATISPYRDTIYTITPGDTSTFKVDVSDRNGVAKIIWNFGDQTTDTTYQGGTISLSHIFVGSNLPAGAITIEGLKISITVIDSIGGSTEKTIATKVIYNDIPTVFVNDTVGEVGTSLTLHSVAEDLGKITYEWSMDGTTFKVGAKDTTIALPATPNVNYPVYVRVKDEDGNVSKVDTIRIIVGQFITDSRDGQRYRITTIGSQTWMAQNLNYKVDSSWWYEDSATYGAKYGRLYTWASAMGLNDSCNTKSCATLIQTKHQGVCPSGWHHPSMPEWDSLVDHIESDQRIGTNKGALALKTNTGWDTYAPGNGNDAFGFSAMPGGYRQSTAIYSNISISGLWWTSTQSQNSSAFDKSANTSNILWYSNPNKSEARSLRCLKD